MFLWGGYRAFENSEWGRFRSAKAADKIPTWTEFLNTAEESERIKYAEQRLATLKETALWNTATRNNTPGLFRTYLTTYPNGEYSAQAHEKYGQLAQSSWTAFKNNPTAQTLATFSS